MSSAAVTLVIAAFLSGAVTAVFVIVVAGIHAGDRPHRLACEPRSYLESLARAVLGVGVRPGRRASSKDSEKG